MENGLLERDKIDEFPEKLSGWKSVENHHILKEFEFSDLKSATDFIKKIEEIGDRMNHHADIDFNLGKVDVKIFTHSVDGLTEKDFKLAMEIEKIWNNYLNQ